MLCDNENISDYLERVNAENWDFCIYSSILLFSREYWFSCSNWLILEIYASFFLISSLSSESSESFFSEWNFEEVTPFWFILVFEIARLLFEAFSLSYNRRFSYFNFYTSSYLSLWFRVSLSKSFLNVSFSIFNLSKRNSSCLSWLI